MSGEGTPSGAPLTLAGFYAARLDEDEALAEAAARSAKWTLDPVIAEAAWVDAGHPEEAPAERHMFRHAPARVLREVAAGRAILAMYEEAAQHPYDLPEGVREGRDDPERERDQYLIDVLGDVVRHLAAVYSDTRGYRDEWKP